MSCGAYRVSALTQGSRTEITVGTDKELNKLVMETKRLENTRSS